MASIEKESLEAHVELCALRYAQLETRLTNLEDKVTNIHEDIVKGQKSLTTVIVSTAGTVIVGVISIVITILMKMG